MGKEVVVSLPLSIHWSSLSLSYIAWRMDYKYGKHRIKNIKPLMSFVHPYQYSYIAWRNMGNMESRILNF